ncbi:MAG: T9SS type A sorting domain-containing protein [Ferruginibacter sp.]
MKKFVLLFFTFSGICFAFAQKPAETLQPDSSGKSTPLNDSFIKKEKPFIKLFPNPARNKVEVEIKGFEPGLIKIQIINSTGTVLRDDKRLVFVGNETIILMFSIEPGIYFLAVKQNKKLARAKLIVQ